MKRPISKSRSGPFACVLALLALLLFTTAYLSADKISTRVFIDSSGVVSTGLQYLAAGSDSMFCDDAVIPRSDYTVDYRSGFIAFSTLPSCDSIIFIVYQLPEWMTAPVGNSVPPGKKFITVGADIIGRQGEPEGAAREISLSGNKSFAFIVGRSGEGAFSQGLNIEVDAILADNVRLRGAVSDRIGSDGNSSLPSGFGSTTTLAELDKYYFELIGTNLSASAGDIKTLSSGLMPEKRIKGIGASYSDKTISAAADIGRPAGRFESYSFIGSDGKQGPYQLRTSDGLPTGVVAGSEKVFVDGQLLQGGSTSYYEIDYPAGRIIFSPRVLITSQTRIEVDFEALDTDFEQQILDVSNSVRLIKDRLVIEAGARRESDDKDRLRYGALSPADIDILSQAGDSTELSYRSGVAADTIGAYVSLTDSTGETYFEYVGMESGEYSVSFSYVGEGAGDYYYVGDGVYRFAGRGIGAYLPVVYLPLPTRNDFYFASARMLLYQQGSLSLSYQGNDVDKNLLSPLGDDDNLSSLFQSVFTHRDSLLSSSTSLRYVEKRFASLQRINSVDDDRIWALPNKSRSNDELRVVSDNAFESINNNIRFTYGYLNYKDTLGSHRFDASAQLFRSAFMSPRIVYQSGNSKSLSHPLQRGTYEKQSAGMSVRPIRRLTVDVDYDKEFTRSSYGALPVVDSYDSYAASVRYRGTVATVSRRTDFAADTIGTEGPRLDKLQVMSEEQLGRLRMQAAVTLLQQEALDSDRGTRDEQLYETTIRYSGAGGWLSLLATYRQNRQNGQSTGFRYIYVGSGQGQYRFEDGQYLADEDGDYIRIREELGESQSLSAGSKSHNIFIYPGRLKLSDNLRNILSQVALRLRTEVIEELPGSDKRTIAWILPWQSESGLAYTNRTMREQYRVLFFPTSNYYLLNLLYSHVREEQEAGAILQRGTKEYGIEVKQDMDSRTRIMLDYLHVRKTESGIGLKSLRLRNNRYGTSITVNDGPWQVTPRLEFETISDALSNGKAEGIAFTGNVVYRNTGRGELRFTGELRSLREKQQFTQPEYLVTDGKRFGKSATVSLIANFDLSKTMRLNINLTDRIYENRPAEFTGRGEVVASF
ncbi:MAG: hypothetical protein R3F48_06480 [Candidatus Zixiibacteriota bacterium]